MAKFNPRGYPTFRGALCYDVILDAKQVRAFGSACKKCGTPIPEVDLTGRADGRGFVCTLTDAGLYHVRCTPRAH